MRLQQAWSQQAWSSERAETVVPAALIGCALVLDGLAEEGGPGHGVALVARSVGLALCAISALRGLGRFGESPLGRRFSLWRACGLVAGGLSLALVVLARWPAFLRPTDGGVALELVALGWILLTGSVWNSASWDRLIHRAPGEVLPSPAPSPSLSWRGLGAPS